MRCHACATAVALASGERVGFRDACSSCGADLHACRNCAHHDPQAAHGCRETQAEPVQDAERANRCEWFRPGDGDAGADSRAASERAQARAALDALFDKGD